MPIEFRLPELGENVTKAQVVNVLVKPGDRITSDQVVLEVETDKAVLEIPCPHGGIVTQVFAQPGTELSIGAPVLAIEAEPDATVKTAA
jgi:pyruvate dehydrogenase E2 component (dihydrolipoamide acetyltransferase)